jgi:hypothetical protein
MPKNPPRRKIPVATENEVLSNSARRCALCFHLNGDLEEKKGQIAHLDKNRANCTKSNLAWLCLLHHSVFDSKTRQHKNYTATEVKIYRGRLYRAVKKGLHFETRSHLISKKTETRTLRLLQDVVRGQRLATPTKKTKSQARATRRRSDIQLTVHTGAYSEDKRAVFVVVDIANRGETADQIIEWSLRFDSLDLALVPSKAPTNLVMPIPEWSSLLVKIAANEFIQGTLFFKDVGKLAEELPREPLIGMLTAKNLHGKTFARNVQVYRLVTLMNNPALAH